MLVHYNFPLHYREAGFRNHKLLINQLDLDAQVLH